MSDVNEPIDPTAFGLFFVAVVSLPIAMVCILTYAGVENHILDSASPGGLSYLGALLGICAIFILISALKAYKAGSNFGFTVLGLVAMGVFFAGVHGGDLYINLTLGIIYLLTMVWSIRIGTPKILTVILITTSLIFIFGGINANTGAVDIWLLLKGIVAMANFLLSAYLAMALVDEKLLVI